MPHSAAIWTQRFGWPSAASRLPSRSNASAEVAAGDRAELVDDLPARWGTPPAARAPTVPRPGGAAAEVGRHVLDHHGGHQLGPVGGQAPGMQTAHRVADQHGGAGIAEGVAEVFDKALRADRMRIGHVTAPVPGGVVGVNPCPVV